MTGRQWMAFAGYTMAATFTLAEIGVRLVVLFTGWPVNTDAEQQVIALVALGAIVGGVHSMQTQPTTVRRKKRRGQDYGDAFVVSLRGQLSAMVRSRGESAARTLLDEAIDRVRREREIMGDVEPSS